ncbi:MAG: undecaprenyl-phosphate alpha-N-acetylglucosaminyl 1-phosphate transferase [Halochromatium sp.]|nr:undecaprenyl-phosphate alpha-N-acetylglucosaminyl 1-phosphate transferase [Halochromatium sp.]
MAVNLGIALITTAAISTAAHFVFHKLAPRLGLLDHPSERRKIHSHAVAPVGGIAIFTAVLTAVLLYGQPSIEFGYGLLGGAVLVIVGLIDDRFNLGYRIRLFAQIVAASILTIGGDITLSSLGDLIGIGPLELGHLAAPLTIFAIVGLINAINMTDGIDGLAGGLVLINIAGVLMVLPPQSETLALLLPILFAAMLPYLACNLEAPGFRGRKVFLGDAGSLLLGYIVAWALIDASSQAPAGLTPVGALWLIAIPLMDTLSVMGRRMLRRASPFKADRGHLHHLLTRMTGSTRVALVMILSLALLLAAFGLMANELQMSESALFAIALLTFLAYLLLQSRIPGFYRWLKRRQRSAVGLAVNESI